MLHPRRRQVVTCAAVTLAVFGCSSTDEPVGTPIEQVWERPAAPSPQTGGVGAADAAPVRANAADAGQPAESRPADPEVADEAVALVNGSPITRRQMVETLMATHGLSLMEQLILLTAARQRAAQMGLTVTAADVRAAHDDALRRLAAPVGGIDDQPLDRATAERLLDEFLLAKNISRREWDRRMEQQAYLRKIASAEAGKMEVTDEMLRDEYALAYGERVQIRHIQVPSLQEAGRVRAALFDLNNASSASAATRPAARLQEHTNVSRNFELIARQMSENQLTAARGGLMPPFTRNDPTVTPLIRETAFSLEVGQISPPINEGDRYHIIMVERRFPASEVGFENIDHAKLRQQFLERRIRQRQEMLEAELFRSAAIDVQDPELARQFKQRYRQGAR